MMHLSFIFDNFPLVFLLLNESVTHIIPLYFEFCHIVDITLIRFGKHL